MASRHYHGVLVSRDHYIVLSAYERKYGVPAQVNSGKRTIAGQIAMVREKGLYNAVTNPHGAAWPVPSAPHIKYGQGHHALDINAGSGKGQSQHVAAFYRSLGIPVAFNVSTEPWHMDTLSRGALRNAAKKLGKVLPTLRVGRRGPSVIYLKKLLYEHGYRKFSGKKRATSNRFSPTFTWRTRDAVKRFQKAHGLKADGVVGPGTWRKLKKR